MDSVIVAKGLVKKYKKFTLGPVDLEIPKGFSTALIGANGAGKTTLLDTICGIVAPSKGEVTYFGEVTDIEEGETKERIGYLAAQGMYPMSWTPYDVATANKLGFTGFHEDRYWEFCKMYGVAEQGEKRQTLMKMSDGNRIRLCLAAVFARETELLVLDEPGSNLDPLMRDRLCGQFREYLEEGDGEKTILFSTHNIADMENVTDYAILMYDGAIIEAGFVNDLCEKYVLVSGERTTFDKVKRSLMVEERNMSTCFGFAKAEEKEKLEAAGAVVELPNLQQLSIFSASVCGTAKFLGGDGMRELKWSLGKLRGFSLFVLGILAIVLFVASKATDGRNLFAMAYRIMFAMLQIMMYVMLWERFSVVLRRSQFYRFYRSMPDAWEKEQCRFLWIDGFFLVCAAAVFAIGTVFRDTFTGGSVPTVLVLIFLAHGVMVKVFAILPYWAWWILEMVFFWITLLLPMERIPVGVGIGAVGGYFIIQFFLYCILKKYWYMEK